MSGDRNRSAVTVDPRSARERCAVAVGAVAADVFTSLDETAERVREVIDSARAEGRLPASDDLQGLRSLLLHHLARHGRLFDGTGVVIAPGVLGDQERYLEWWRGPGPQKLPLDFDPGSESFYDYTLMEWFTVPRDEDRRVAYGPWVDYSGSDLYVITFARPIRDERGEFVGVAGADVPLAGLEEAVMPALRASAVDVALVNGSGRVVAASSPVTVQGSRLRSIAAGDCSSVPEMGTGWRVVSL
jgi:hypothetical protein